jgi:hypothetical protein
VADRQLNLFPAEHMPTPEWERVSARGGVFGTWRHRSGWLVRHCGHPTALWPYYLIAPDGTELVEVDGHRTWSTLAQAKKAVESVVYGRPA